MTPRRVAFLLGFIALLVVASATQISQSSSSYASTPNGTKALYELLSQLDRPVERWRRPLSELPAGIGEAVLIIRPLEIDSISLAELRPWIERGNTVVVFGMEIARSAFTHFGAESTLQPEDDSEFSDMFAPRDAQALIDCSNELSGYCQAETVISRDSTATIAGRGDALPLLTRGSRVLALRIPLGSGNVITVFGNTFYLNEYIDKHQNLEVVLGLLAPYSKIWVDEFHNGYREEVAVERKSYFIAVLTFAGILLSCVLAAVLSRSIRFVPPLPDLEYPAVSTDLTNAVALLLYQSKEPKALSLYAAAYKDRVGAPYGAGARYSTTEFCDVLERAGVSETKEVHRSLTLLESGARLAESQLALSISVLEKFAESIQHSTQERGTING